MTYFELKNLKTVQIMLAVLFSEKMMKIMLVRPDYAKNYASTIYSSLESITSRTAKKSDAIMSPYSAAVFYLQCQVCFFLST